MLRRPLTLGATAIAFCLALILVARWEREQAGEQAAAGIATVKALVGTPLASGQAEAYLRLDKLTCFFYTRGTRRWGVSLCYDDEGRLVEATDGRDGDPKVWTVRMDRALAAERVEPAQVQAAVDALSRRAILNAVRTTAVFTTVQNCTSRLRNVVGNGLGPKPRSTLSAALDDCRQASASIVDLGRTYLEGAPGVRQAFDPLLQIIRDTEAEFEALAAVLPDTPALIDELKRAKRLDRSLSDRVGQANANLGRAIEDEV